MTSDSSRHRLGLLAVAALSLFGALFARLWFLQVVESDTLSVAAEGNVTETVITPAPRGEIFDRNGLALVTNRESIVVGIEAQEFEELEAEEQDAMLEKLAVALSLGRTPDEQVTADELRDKVGDVRYSRLAPVPVAEDITVEDEIYFAEQAADYPSVVVERTTVRDYPYGTLAAHVLGYVGPLSDSQWERLQEENDPDKPYVQTDEIGKAGVEATYEEHLRGVPGRQTFEVDRRGNVVREITAERVDPVPGEDLYLSLDARVQAETELALKQGLEQRQATPGELGYYPAEAGAAAVVDPTDGQVIAMASYPTYDPSELVGGISCPTWRDLQGLEREGSCGESMAAELEDREDPPVSKLLNRAIQGTYPAGSTFKLASAYAGLELGIITPQTTINDPGYFVIPGCSGSEDSCRVSSPSAESGGVGPVALERALTVSSDTYFYKLGNDSWALYKQQEKVGPTAFQEEVRMLGFDAPTGVDLPSESSGRIPDPEWLAELDRTINGGETEAGRWGSGNSINMAIGQGDVLVTPLQVANAYATFANGGTLYQPQVMSRVTAPGQPDQVVLQAEPIVLGTVDFGDAYDDMMRGFEGVTLPGTGGTASSAFAGFPQDSWPVAGKTGTAEQGTDSDPKEDHSWFVGFGPTSGASRYSAAVVMESSGAGGSAAAPAVRRILEPIALNKLTLARLQAITGAVGLNPDGSEAAPDDGSADGGSTTSTTAPGTAGTTGTTGVDD